MQRLPDLTPWVSENRGYLHNWSVRGDELRLTTAFANVGTGNMEIRGGATHDGVQDVYQRIYNDDGTYTDRLAGEFVHHPGHGHIHFEDFAEFRLRAVDADGGVGDVVATGDKVSFCLIDVARYDGSAGGRAYSSCGQVQGISAGWADVYSQGLPGQSINIEGIVDGTYWLEVAADPNNLLQEADETNNVARIQINLERGVVATPISPDAFETNDSFDTASELAPPEDHRYDDLTIHAPGEHDYYRVTASATGELTFSLAFSHAEGDIDLRVYDASRNPISASTSVSDGESITVDAQANDVFYVDVYGYNGATNSNYSLNVDQPGAEPPALEPDRFEPNNSFANARVLVPQGTEVYDNLSIDNANDQDYFTFTASETGAVKLHLDFLSGQGSIQMSAYDSGQNLLAQSMSRLNHEHIDLNVVAGEQYYIAVNGYNGATNPQYSLTIEAPTAAPGNEVADVPNVTQYLNGEADNDVFVIAGNAADYGWGVTEDGEGTVVWGPTGHDLLYGFENIRFADVTVPLTQSGGRFDDIQNVVQYLDGPGEEDTFVIDGNSSDYGWGATEDGLGIVVWGPTGHDLLYDFEKIAFNDRTVELGGGSPAEGLVVADDPARTQYEFGTEQTDRFVINGNSADYGWGATEDGQGTVVWNDSDGSHDLLYDFEEIAFNDETVMLAEVA